MGIPVNQGFHAELKELMDKHNLKSITPVSEEMLIGYTDNGEYLINSAKFTGK